MGQKFGNPRREYRRKGGNTGDSLEGSEDLSVAEILKRIQRQMTFLERKVDHLTSLLENKPHKEPYHSKFSQEGRRPYQGSKDRKFSGRFQRGAGNRSDERQKDKDSSFWKPFGKRGAYKKKSLSDKKSFGKYQDRNSKKSNPRNPE